MTNSNLLHAADELPAERAAISPVTLLGAAHTWAARAKEAEARLDYLKKRVRFYQSALVIVTGVFAGSWGVALWVLG